ncbi:unnamed protein product, partial [marine sediment metagenome]
SKKNAGLMADFTIAYNATPLCFRVYRYAGAGVQNLR